MKVHYRNTFRDIMAFCFYHYPRSPFVVGSYLVFLVVLSVFFVMALPKEASTGEKIVVFVVLELIAAALFAGSMAISIVLSMISSKNKTVLTDHTLILGEENFVEETVYNRTEQTWGSVQKLARTRRYIFIYVAQHMAHVIPRRAFATDGDWEAFYSCCRVRVESASLKQSADALNR
jgi:hypothetical protein